MTLTNTFLATVASFVPLGDGAGAELPKQSLNNSKLAASVSKLGDEYRPASNRVVAEEFAQFGFGAPIENRRYGGSFSPMQQLNQRLSPYGLGGINSRFGAGQGASNGLFRRYQSPQNRQNQQPPQANSNQNPPQSAIKSHQANKDQVQLNFQERILSQKFVDKLKFKDNSVSEKSKQEIAAILAKTQNAFNKLPEAEQTEAKYGELFNANSKASGYQDGATEKIISGYYKLSKKIQNEERKSIPEPNQEASSKQDSAAENFGYKPVTSAPNGRTNKAQEFKADELAYLKKIVGVENISDQNLLEVKNFASGLSKLQPGEQKKYRDAYVQTRFKTLGFKDQEQLRSALDTIANDPAETIKK